MIISKKKYEEMCNLIVTQREAIRLLEEQLYLIRKTNLSSIYGRTNDIDFPNSRTSCENKLF